MAMIPFFPSLNPSMANKVWFNFNNIAGSDEADIARMEREHTNWLESFKTVTSEINPLGRVLLVGPETDEEDANDDSDDTDTHDEEDDDTNDRVMTGNTERSALGAYSPGDETNVNDETAGGSV